MEMVLFEKGTSAIRAFFKRPQKHRHIVLCYIGLYTILQLQVVSARHHDLGKLLAVSNNNNNNDNDNNFNENELNSLHQQSQQQQQPQSNNYAQINHSREDGDLLKHQQDQQQQTILKQPILGQKITQQSPGSDLGPSGAVLSKDDGKYFSFNVSKKKLFISSCTK
jgi:hypothetical protein